MAGVWGRSGVVMLTSMFSFEAMPGGFSRLRLRRLGLRLRAGFHEDGRNGKGVTPQCR